jgi:uncharacterized protein
MNITESVVTAETANWINHLILLLFIAPVFEEFVVRAGIQAGLSAKKWGLSNRILLCALIFAAMHALRSWQLALAVLPVAVLLGYVYEKSGSWRICAVAHAVMNGIWITVSSGPKPPLQILF